jgi:alkanesulfonate monooxygenase SsuD/methylene tetrahydromethanopterin reductase-like flavin-dependent oxidoreductase (luciferase family)
MTRWGVLLPTFDPLRTGQTPPVAAAAALAEQAGFDGVWVGDHLLCPAPVLDATLCLAAAAAVTERVSLGFSVMLLALRPAAWAAKQVATLQCLAGARVKLGVGVGGEFPQEFAAAGVPVRERGRRLDATLSALPVLLGAKRRVDGEQSGAALGAQARGNADVPPLEPAVAMPPILVGGRSDAALRRAARFGDAWLPMWLSPSRLGRRIEALDAHAGQLGRRRPALAMLIGVRVDEDAARARTEAEAHVRGQYGMELSRIERWTALGGAQATSEFLDAYRTAGVEEFLLMPLGGRPLEQIERLAAVVAQLR